MILTACGLSGCGASAAPWKPSSILTIDQAAETVHLHLLSSATNNFGGFNFDGYGAGEMRVRVPLGWTVNVTCKNASTVLTHSCAITNDLPVSPHAGALAFPGASSPNPTHGLGFGETASFSFTATKLGNFRIVCLVTGHEADGMWDWLTVTNAGRPSVSV